MKKIRFLILFYLIFTSIKSNAQSISEIPDKICDSINSTKYNDSVSIELSQAKIYSSILTKEILKLGIVELKKTNNDYNALNYKIIRDLNKKCKAFKITNISITPRTNLIEVDSIFSLEQNKKIKKLAAEIRNKNKMEIVILSIDELYPDNEIRNFSNHKLMEWKIGGVLEKGGTIIVFSKNLKKVAISTTETAMKYLTNKDCDKLIADVMIPNFKNNNYYDGIYKSLIEIKNILK
jgi:hypothetical protein